jgi:hypothetical protein
VPVTVIV